MLLHPKVKKLKSTLMRIKSNLIGEQMPKPLGYAFLHRVGCLLCFTWIKVPSWTSVTLRIFFGRTTGFPNLLQVDLAPLPCLTSTWARAPPHPPPSPLWWTLLPPWCLCHRGLAHRGNLNKSSQLNIAHMYCQVRNFGFNMLESISKTGSALAPLVVDLGGQVGWWWCRWLFWWRWCRCWWWC